MKYFLEKHYRPIILLVLWFTLTVSVLNAKNDSLIYDEDAHIPAAWSYLQEQDIRLNPEHPPLLKDLAALPLLLTNPKFDTSQPFWNENANDAQWNAGKYFLFGAGNDPDQIIFLSRLPFILIYFLLTLFVFKWARELGGTLAGLLAFLLFALDPNILGHNHYVTTDLGIAAFLTFAFYFFLKFVKNPSWKNTFLFGLFWALVQLVKFSSVLAIPIFGLILLIYPLIKLNAAGQTAAWKEKLKFLGEYVGKSLIAFFFSLLLVWILYFLNARHTPPEKLPEIVNFYFNKNATALEINTKASLFYLNQFGWSRPLADYFFGVSRVFQRVAGGNVTYFLGEINTRGFLAYFPIVFLIKMTIPSLFLILSAFFIGLWKFVSATSIPVRQSGKVIVHYLRTHITEFSLLLFILLYIVTSILGRLNIGIRHLFPIFPLMFILVAKTVVHAIQKTHDRKEKSAFYFALVILAVLLASETIMAYPNYLSYFNQIAGGPKNGYHYVTDSNADWGQDLKRLAQFLNEHPEIEKIRLDYFGMADNRYYLGNKYEPWWGARRPIEAGWYGISTLFMQESLFDQRKSDAKSYRWLKNKKPAYQVGASILIYYISPQEANLANGPAF